jgi:uncharacterized protein (DUF1697 family)
MADLARAFESAGFTGVKTVLGSGNVVFDATSTSIRAIEAKAEAAMAKHLGKAFFTIVRPIRELEALLAADPYERFRVGAAKRVVTFARAAPTTKPKLPIEQDGARLLAVDGATLFTAYLPTAKGPVFMTLIERTMGKDQTTRTWQTIEKVVKAAA